MQAFEQRTLTLSAEDVQQVISSRGLNEFMDELIQRIDLAFRNYEASKTVIPVRSGFSYRQPYSGLIEWMPLYEDQQAMMLKLVGYHPGNPKEFGIPTILSTISTFDTRTGHLESIVDGVLLTALRTGAASAVASKYLAVSGSRTLGLIGCGMQAVTQLHALSRVFDFERVLLFDPDVQTLESFESRSSSFAADLEMSTVDIETIVLESDIISTATTVEIGGGPLFRDLVSQPHLHINAVGSDFPGKTEIPIEFLRDALVCPDFLDQAIDEGECQQLEEKEIGPAIDYVARNREMFLKSRNQRTVFDSTGWALEDRVALSFVSELAISQGIGSYIFLESTPKDSKNPYEFAQQKEAIERVAKTLV